MLAVGLCKVWREQRGAKGVSTVRVGLAEPGSAGAWARPAARLPPSALLINMNIICTSVACISTR